MGKDKIDELERKKQELQDELARLQDELDHSLDEVRSDVTHKMQPAEFIKNHPLPVVGLSLLLGFLAGHRRRTPKRDIDIDDSQGESSEEGVSHILWKELKKIATRKAVSFAADYLDNFLSEKKEELANFTNGTSEKTE